MVLQYGTLLIADPFGDIVLLKLFKFFGKVIYIFDILFGVFSSER